MKPNQLATLVLRLMAVYILTQAVPMLGMLGGIVTYVQKSEGGSLIGAWSSALFPGMCMMITGLVLLIFAAPLGRKLTPAGMVESEITMVSFQQIQVLAFAVAGLLIFADSLLSLIISVKYFFWWISHIVNKGDEHSGLFVHPESVLRELSAALGNILKAVLGIWLFFGARSFANLFRFLRVAGTPKSP